jgi:predicted RNA binding protein with dsRBD fold (UPF0201 family)
VYTLTKEQSQRERVEHWNNRSDENNEALSRLTIALRRNDFYNVVAALEMLTKTTSGVRIALTLAKAVAFVTVRSIKS